MPPSDRFRTPGDEDALEIQDAFKISEKKKAGEAGGEIIWRGANVLMTAFFVMAAGVQFNDPDPFLWIALYVTASILTVSIAIRPRFSDHKAWKWSYWSHTIFCIGMFFYVLADLVMVATNPQSDGSLNPLMYEEGREMAGIMITALWLIICKQSPTMSSTSSRALKKNRCGMTAAVIVFSVLPLVLWALCYSNVMNSNYISFCSNFYVEEFSF